MSESTYNANSLNTLEGLEHVRRRPGMYIGETDGTGVKHCAFEIIDNADDEAIIGHCDRIIVNVSTEDGTVEVVDNGRGIPMDINEKEGLCGAIMVYSKLNSGGKFSNKNYKFSGGLHGVGGSVVNALSSHLVITVKSDGLIRQVEFKNGGQYDSPEPTVLGKCDPNETGTSVKYKLAPRWFQAAVNAKQFTISEEWFVDMLQKRCCLQAGLVYELNYDGRHHEFVSQNGLSDLISVPDEQTNPILDTPLVFEEELSYKVTEDRYNEDGSQAFRETVDKKDGTVKRVPIKDTVVKEAVVRLSFFAEDKLAPMQAKSFVNKVQTTENGKHLDGTVSGFCQALTEFANENLKRPLKRPLEMSDITCGCQFAVMVMMQDVQFSSQTKACLTTVQAKTITYRAAFEFFSRWLAMNPNEANRLVTKAVRAQDQRIRNEKVRDQSDKEESLGGMSLTGKLTPCWSRDINENELFIVEGDSAGGTAKKAADKNTQAVLPLRGKILNTLKSSDAKVFASEQINILATAIGTGIGKEFDYQKLRYGKIVPLTDADVDGAHIQLLILTMINKYMPELIKRGHVFISVPPLYKLTKKNTANPESIWIRDDKELAEKFPNGIPNNYTKSRFKGLGEMDEDQLRETAMDKHTRTIFQLQYLPEQEEEYDELFEVLMGKVPADRLDFITKNIDFKDIDEQ